jgi:chaperonin GroEL
MPKIIRRFDNKAVLNAVNRIAEPVIQTLTPLGNNVMFEKDLHTLITNDGATIAKLIDSDDEVEDSIIQMVKYGSLATNQLAGDGTSTTILLTKKLIELGIEEIDNGKKPMALRSELLKMSDKIIDVAETLKTEVSIEDNTKLYDVALVSSGGDDVLARNVVDIISTAGLDGMIFLNESKNSDTKIIKDTGYNLEEPMLNPVLGNISQGRAEYNKPYVFITDKKLYHVEECKEILEVAFKSGVNDIVIVARDFIGESGDFLIANHLDKDVPLNILLVKYQLPDDDFTPMYDLATYLGSKVITEKMGNLKGKLNADSYKLVERVYSNGVKTVFVSDIKINPELTMLVDTVRKKKEEDPSDDVVSRRLASLTTGTVSVEVGATTGPELRELIYRYEDSINATRAAVKSGYVTGGGLTLYNSTRELDNFGKEFGTVSIKQIAENCGVPFNEDEYAGDTGLNAQTLKYSNLAEDGVIEPYDVFKYSVVNAVSIATSILTSGYFIVNKSNKDND